MSRRDRADRRGAGRRRRGGCGCGLLVLVLLVAALLVAAELGARWYLTDRAEQEASDRLGAPVSVEIGPSPVLWGLATVQAVREVHLTSPGGATIPQLDVTGRSVSLVDGGIRADTAEGTATLDGPQLTAAAAEGNPAEGTPVAGLAEVRSVRPDPAADLLRADIGGIAEIGVSPSVVDGRLVLTPEQTSLLGFELPGGLFGGVGATVDATVDSLPDGVRIEGARVVPEGLEVALGGTDVLLR